MTTNKIEDLRIIGFAKGNGNSVHAIMKDGSNKIKGEYTLCSINTKNKRLMPIENGFKSIDDITCAKCKRTAFYKSQIEQNKQTTKEDIKNDKKEDIKLDIQDGVINPKDNIKTETKQEQLPIIEETTKETKKEDHSCKTCTCENKSTPNKPKFIEKIRDIAENFQNGDVHFYARIKSTNFRYRIKHRKSGLIWFDDIPENIVLQSLAILNNMDSRWNGRSCIPEDFITQCKHAMIAAFRSVGKDYPEALEVVVEKHKYQACKKYKYEIKLLSKPKLKIRQKKRLALKIRNR